MHLRELFETIDLKGFHGENVEVKGISHNSKDVSSGDLFVAVKGMRHDGHSFIDEAKRRGAVAFLVDHIVDGLEGLNYGIVENTREVLGVVASRFYGNPSQSMTVIGITGTNGKTTTMYLLESILKASGKEVGVIGTIGAMYGDRVINTSHTTPDSIELQRILRGMVDHGVSYCVMEVSSHSISMKRLVGCSFKAGVYTNISQDHLDFHGDMDGYFDTKASFFTNLIEGRHRRGFSVVNVDDPMGDRLLKRLKRRVITYGISDGAITPQECTLSAEGIEGRLNTPQGELRFRSSLIGEFNLYNIMAAVATAIGLGIPLYEIGGGIEALKGVRGRMEIVHVDDGPDVVIDYAHTPSALEKVLDALRPLRRGKIITVFGCGGDRDRGKRPLMGRIATEASDMVVLTSDNPRSEDPLEIIKDIEKGIEDGCEYIVEVDRREAIKKAIGLGRDGDIVLLAGKGHEDYQIIGDDVIHFSDMEEVQRLLYIKRGQDVVGS